MYGGSDTNVSFENFLFSFSIFFVYFFRRYFSLSKLYSWNGSIENGSTIYFVQSNGKYWTIIWFNAKKPNNDGLHHKTIITIIINSIEEEKKNNIAKIEREREKIEKKKQFATEWIGASACALPCSQLHLNPTGSLCGIDAIRWKIHNSIVLLSTQIDVCMCGTLPRQTE